MSDRLCLYYSRTGNTRAAAEKVAELLEAELVELTDGKARGGILGFLASGLDAMRKTPQELLPFQTEQPLGPYDHVIVATPVWAGRCSSIVHAFLAAYGRELPQKVSYLVTHMGVSSYNEVCTQMQPVSCSSPPVCPVAAAQGGGLSPETLRFCARCQRRRGGNAAVG